VRQIDRHLYDGLVPWSVIELTTDGLLPGNYRLALILYDRLSGEKVSGFDSAHNQSESVIPLLSFGLDSQ